MMTPEMMQRMMGQCGRSGMMRGMAGQRVPEDGVGLDMASPHQLQTADMMMGPMMRMMMSGRAGMGMLGLMGSQGILLGALPDTPEEMTVDRVRSLLGRQLSNLGNPRLKLGEIGTASDGSITVEIVTVDGSLGSAARVQPLSRSVPADRRINRSET